MAENIICSSIPSLLPSPSHRAYQFWQLGSYRWKSVLSRDQQPPWREETASRCRWWSSGMVLTAPNLELRTTVRQVRSKKWGLQHWLSLMKCQFCQAVPGSCPVLLFLPPHQIFNLDCIRILPSRLLLMGRKGNLDPNSSFRHYCQRSALTPFPMKCPWPAPDLLLLPLKGAPCLVYALPFIPRQCPCTVPSCNRERKDKGSPKDPPSAPIIHATPPAKGQVLPATHPTSTSTSTSFPLSPAHQSRASFFLSEELIKLCHKHLQEKTPGERGDSPMRSLSLGLSTAWSSPFIPAPVHPARSSTQPTPKVSPVVGVHLGL